MLEFRPARSEEAPAVLAFYETMIDAMADVKVECATLEKEYLGRFKEILPAKKLMRVQMAEERYQRELLRGMQQGSHKHQGAAKQ